MSANHEVKSWSYLYDAIASGAKTHDLRKNDRDYKVGDTIKLRRYDTQKGEYTGEECPVLVTYITGVQYPCAFSSAVLPREYVILSIRKI